MEKIDIDTLQKGNEQFDVQKMIYIAEKVNEIVDWINEKKDQLL